jgi:hypothetical protein
VVAVEYTQALGIEIRKIGNNVWPSSLHVLLADMGGNEIDESKF